MLTQPERCRGLQPCLHRYFDHFPGEAELPLPKQVPGFPHQEQQLQCPAQLQLWRSRCCPELDRGHSQGRLLLDQGLHSHPQQQHSAGAVPRLHVGHALLRSLMVAQAQLHCPGMCWAWSCANREHSATRPLTWSLGCCLVVA